MNGIERISDRLVADAEAEIAALNADTAARCGEIRAEYQRRAQEEYQTRLAEGVRNAETRLQRLGSAAEMEAKKSILAFKQEMVAKAFADAAEKLANLPQEQYVKFLASQAAAAAATRMDRSAAATSRSRWASLSRRQFSAAAATSRSRWAKTATNAPARVRPKVPNARSANNAEAAALSWPAAASYSSSRPVRSATERARSSRIPATRATAQAAPSAAAQ
jgi:vacuolar-type H+-ATPase subunit E/Vma4